MQLRIFLKALCLKNLNFLLFQKFEFTLIIRQINLFNGKKKKKHTNKMINNKKYQKKNRLKKIRNQK